MLDYVKACLPGGFSLLTARDNPACAFYEREGLAPARTFWDPGLGYQVARYEWRRGD